MTVEYRIDVSRSLLIVKCSRVPAGECGFTISTDPPGRPTWHWDGNESNPTVIPAIKCKRCSVHFTLTAGEIKDHTK